MLFRIIFVSKFVVRTSDEETYHRFIILAVEASLEMLEHVLTGIGVIFVKLPCHLRSRLEERTIAQFSL